MCRITTSAVVSMLALAVLGVEQIPQQKDYGSLVYVAAYDSCATDKARADVEGYRVRHGYHSSGSL